MASPPSIIWSSKYKVSKKEEKRLAIKTTKKYDFELGAMSLVAVCDCGIS